MELPKSSTGGAAPHRKTPKGDTRSLQVNYRLDAETRKRSKTQFQHLEFFCETARQLGLHLDIHADGAAMSDLKDEQALLKDVAHDLVTVPVLGSEWLRTATSS